MKNKSYIFLLGVGALALFSAGLFYNSSLLKNAKISETQGEVIISSVHWTKDFNGLREMVADSDLVVVGIVIGSQPSRLIRDNLPPEIEKNIEQAGGVPGLIVTDYSFRVEKVLKGQLSKGDTIIIVQTGGTYNGVKEYIEDDPLFEVEERAVLFLNDISGDSILAPNEQKYTINGTPQARFRVTNNQVVPIVMNKPFVAGFKGMKEEDFIRTIQKSSP